MKAVVDLAAYLRERTRDGEHGCRDWTGVVSGKRGKEYGQVRLACLRNSGVTQRATVGAHRLAWIAARGAISDGLFVLHKCDNRFCVNVDHLFLGTKADNNADRDRKGRECSGERHPRARLTRAEAIGIYSLRGLIPATAIARWHGISICVPYKIWNGESWRRVTGHGQ